MENILSTVTWVAPLILTIIFSGLIPLMVHMHKISRKPIIKVSSRKVGRDEKEFALTASLTLDELTVGEKYHDWYVVCIKNMDSSPFLLKSIRANGRAAKYKNYIYILPGEEMLIKLPQDLAKKKQRVILNSFTVDIRGKDARFRIKIRVDNPYTIDSTDNTKIYTFPKYEIYGISWRPF